MLDGAAPTDLAILLCLAAAIGVAAYLCLRFKWEFVAAVIGFAIASIIPAALLAGLSPLNGPHNAGSTLISFPILWLFSAAFTVILGLPAFLILRPFKPGHWWSVSAVGFLLGVSVVAIVQGSLSLSSNPEAFGIYGIAGALSALVFWSIWRPSVSQQNACCN
jgi:hypothetical protein